MAKSEKFSCDGCGKQKGDVNCWWMSSQAVSFELFPWMEKCEGQKYLKHYCGQECATKALSEFMQKGKG